MGLDTFHSMVACYLEDVDPAGSSFIIARRIAIRILFAVRSRTDAVPIGESYH
jgi:hypothetical protein